MAIDTEEAIRRLGSIADVFLVHDRPIVRPVDDSVVRVGPTGLQVLRRARGYAPGTIDLGREGPTILAVGGHLKNAIALSLESEAVLGSHVGDLDSLQAVEVHRRAIHDLVDFFQAAPEAVACDLHPDYASTQTAAQLAADWDVPLVRLQHHHTHVASCMAEHRLEVPVLGLAWDGTGYGGDGTVWGGEALICDGAEFTRVAHLRHFALPGGDRAARQPRRSALGLFYAMFGPGATEHAAQWFTPVDLKALMSLIDRNVHAPHTSSMGRLFDVVAALCGLGSQVSFEGQAAMALEFAADRGHQPAYPLPISDSTPAVIDWEPMIRSVLSDRASGVPVEKISARFHNALAEAAVATAQRSGCRRVVLSGGCFQNALLTERVHSRLSQAGFDVYTHQEVPPGDGGIALGQLALAIAQLRG